MDNETETMVQAEPQTLKDTPEQDINIPHDEEPTPNADNNNDDDDLEWFTLDDEKTGAEEEPEPRVNNEEEPGDAEPADDSDADDAAENAPGKNEEDTKDAIIRKLRAEAAKRRQQVKEEREKSVEAVEEALGIVLKPVLEATGAETVDIDEIPKQLQRTLQEAQAAKLELALYKASVEIGADVEQLKDSMSFMEKISKLDSRADSFQKDVIHAVRNATHDNPRFKQPQKITRSGADFTNGGVETPRTNSIEELIKRRKQRRNA